MADKRKPRPRAPDANETAFRVMREATAEHDPDADEPEPEPEPPPGKNPYAVALGRRGGLKGGKARAEKMSAEERSASARKAAEARWAKKKP
jgi:hypothetical protein